MGGLKPGTWAHVALIGWSFEFKSATPRPIHQIGIFTQKAIIGGWQWANDFDVNANGEINVKIVAFINDDNDDDPYDFTVNCLVIGD